MDFGHPCLFSSTAYRVIDFSLSGHVDQSQYADYFEDLATLIKKYPPIAQHAKFVIIPGPADTGSAGVVPRPPVSREAITSGFTRSSYWRVLLLNQMLFDFHLH